jgi:hypothetical protein
MGDPSVNLGTARSLSLETGAQPVEGQETLDQAAALSRREATLRAGATTCLVGIALVQAIGLPYLLAQGTQLAVLSMATMAVCVGLGLSLAAASAGAARQLWRAVAAADLLVIAGWAAPHVFAVPGLAGDRGQWTAPGGAVSAVLAVVCLVVAAVAAPPTRASLRGLLTTAAVVLALAPGAGVMLVSLGPGTFGGETVLAAGAHIHSHGSFENAIVYQALPGGKGGHYVYKASAAPHQTIFEAALIIVAGLIFIYGVVGYLRRRVAAGGGDPVALSGVGRGMA